MNCDSISIPLNQRRYQKKLQDLQLHSGVEGLYESAKNSHGETDLIVTLAANDM